MAEVSMLESRSGYLQGSSEPVLEVASGHGELRRVHKGAVQAIRASGDLFCARIYDEAVTLSPR